MMRIYTTLAAIAAATLCALSAADGPMSIRTLAPDSTYVMVIGDDWTKTLGKWDTTGLHGLMQTEPMKKIFGGDGAAGGIAKHLKEIGAPEGSTSWPEAFGAAFYLSHNAELDTEEQQMLFYADWGARADATDKLVEAVLADAVKKESWKVDTGDEIAGRKVTMVTFPEDARAKEFRERFGGQVGIEMTRPTEKIFYTRDGTRFFICTERAGLQEALAAADGSRKCKVPETKEFQQATDQLGAKDVSMVLLMEPMQKAINSNGQWAMAQPYIQPLIGDVQAVTLGLELAGAKGQAALTGAVLMPGPKKGLWTLFGPNGAIDRPPPMVGPEAISYSRINFQFREVMPLLQMMLAKMPKEQTVELDLMLQSMGDVLTKGFEAMGPGIWLTSQVRQPVNAESLVSTTIIACSNPKAVVPMIAQFGAQLGLEPRDVDGNTIFGDDSSMAAIGVANGYMAVGDNRQVQQAMRAMGQKDLPSVADSAVYKRCVDAAGSEGVTAWGFSDIIARWAYDREMMQQEVKEESQMGGLMDRTDDSPWAKRLGYKLPDNTRELMTALEPATLAKFVGPTLWTIRMGDKGLVAQYLLLPGSGQ